MSDAPQGEGWWLASDGKWYPPQTQTPAAAPVTAPPPAPSGGRSKAPLIVAIVAVLVIGGIAAALLLGGDDEDETGSASTLSDEAAIERGNVLLDTIERELIPAGQRYDELQADPSDPEFADAVDELEAALGRLVTDFNVVQPEDAELDEQWDRMVIELADMRLDVIALQEAIGTSDVDTQINTVNRAFPAVGDAVTNLEEALADAGGGDDLN